MNADYKNNIRNGLLVQKDRFYAFLFCSMFFLPIIFGYFSEILYLFNFNTLSIVLYFFIYCLSFIIYFVALFLNPQKTFAPFLITCVFILCQILFYPKVEDFLFDFTSGLSNVAQSKFFLLCFLGLSMVWISLCLRSQSLLFLKIYLKKYAYVTTSIFIIVMLLQFVSERISNYMTIAYNAVPSLFIMIYFGFHEKKSLSVLLFVIGAFFIVFGGCRGAMLQLMVGALLCFIFNGKSIFSLRKFIAIILILTSIMLFIMFFDQIITELDGILKSMGYNSRLLSKIIGYSADGDIFYYGDRQMVNEKTIEAFTLFGNGIFVYEAGVGYPHNIVLEFILSFGYIFGAFLLFVLFGLLIVGFVCAIKTKDYFEMVLWVSAATTVFIKLMFSASYLTDRPFWFYISIVLFMVRTRGHREKCVNT